MSSRAVIFILFTLAIIQITLSATPLDHTDRILPITTPYHEAHIKPLDPFASSWSIYCNQPGLGPQDYATVNFNSDIRVVLSNSLQVGIQGGEYGYLVDLGNEGDLRTQYKISSSLSYVFSSIGFKDNKLQLVTAFGNIPTYAPLTNATELLFPSTTKSNADTALLALNHIYLMRITQGTETLLIAKFKVTMIVTDPDTKEIELVTLRTQPLYVKDGIKTSCRNSRQESGSSGVGSAFLAVFLLLLIQIVIAAIAFGLTLLYKRVKGRE